MKTIAAFLICLFLISSCSITQRKYRKGFEVQWNRQKSEFSAQNNHAKLAEKEDNIKSIEFPEVKENTDNWKLNLPNSLYIPENLSTKNKPLKTKKVKNLPIPVTHQIPVSEVNTSKTENVFPKEPVKHPVLFEILTGILAVFIAITHPFWNILQMIFSKEVTYDMILASIAGFILIFFIIMGFVYASTVWITLSFILYFLNLLWSFHLWNNDFLSRETDE